MRIRVNNNLMPTEYRIRVAAPQPSAHKSKIAVSFEVAGGVEAMSAEDKRNFR